MPFFAAPFFCQASTPYYVSFLDIGNPPKIDLVRYLVYFRGIISIFAGALAFGLLRSVLGTPFEKFMWRMR